MTEEMDLVSKIRDKDAEGRWRSINACMSKVMELAIAGQKKMNKKFHRSLETIRRREGSKLRHGRY